jgi:hypothetical protein
MKYAQYDQVQLNMKFIGYNNNIRIVALFVIVDLQALFYR